MVDLNAISLGLTSVRTALEIVKDLKSIDSSLKDAEVKLKLADLIEALSEAKINLSEAKIENQNLKDEIENLKAQINLKDEVEFKDGYYYRINHSKGQEPGPFCAMCYNDLKKLIPMSELPRDMQDFGKYRCAKCQHIK